MESKYIFDPTGKSPANRIVNEQHVITAVNFRDYHYVIPKFAPFFKNDFTIRIQFPDGEVRSLFEGQDYYLSNQFIDASRACATPLYGSISFLDTTMHGIMSISYNTVGDKWTLTLQEITRILAEEMRNPRTTTWEQITNLPERFPVVDHEWDLVDMVGAKDLVKGIDGVRDAVLAAGGADSSGHFSNTSNPHNVTKAQVGLSNVANFPVATLEQAVEGLAVDAYMTPRRVSEAIGTIGKALVTTHSSRIDNPHGVTKAQVGLSLVQNFAIASAEQAIAGVAADVYMTPALTTIATSALVDRLNAHEQDFMNPHRVDKDQVGLFNVENYPVASEQEARAGIRSDRYMTPLRTMQTCREFVTLALQSHSDRTDNPHGVFKDQVGLAQVQNYPVATELQAREMTSNAAYMTPLRTLQLCREFVTVQLDGHATLVNNPHQTTKEQVGLGKVDNFATATAQDAVDGTAADKFMTPALTRSMIQSSAGSVGAHVADKNNPHNVTAEQLSVYTKFEMSQVLLNYLPSDGVAFDSTRFSGMTTNEYVDWLRVNLTEMDATTLGGLRASDIVREASGAATGMLDYDYVSKATGANTWIKLGWIEVDPLAPNVAEDLSVIVAGGARTLAPSTSGPGSVPILISASLRRLVNSAPEVKGVYLLGSPGAGESDLVVGYEWNATLKRLTLWAKVPKASHRVTVSEISGRKLIISDEMGIDGAGFEESLTEPTGIKYVTPYDYVKSTTFNELDSEVDTLSTSVTQLANQTDQKFTTVNQTLSIHNQAINSIGQTNTSQGQAIDALTQSFTDLQARVKNIEDLLDSIQVS